MTGRQKSAHAARRGEATDGRQHQVESEGEQDRENGAGPDRLHRERKAETAQAVFDEDAETRTGHEGCDGCETGGDQGRHTNTGQNHRPGQGQLNADQALGAVQSHATCRLEHIRVDLSQTRDGVAKNRQDRVEEEGDEGGLEAEADDRDEDREQGE